MEISIGVVLSKIDASENSNQEFTLGFISVKSNEYREIRCKKGFKDPSILNTQKQANQRKFHSIKDNDLLLIFDVEAKRPKNLKIKLIQEFNGHRVIH